MAKPADIKKTFGKKGDLHKALGVPLGQKIPPAKLAAGAKMAGSIGAQARLLQKLEATRKK
jgi:hypothetical protein